MRRAGMLFLLVAVGSWSGTGTAAQERLTPERLWQFVRISGPSVSPDGRTIVFGATRYDVAENRGNADLYLVPVAGGPAWRLTEMPGSEVGATWRPDGRRIGFLSAESGSMQLWEIAPDGSDLRQVSEINGGIDNFRYAPTGTRVSFTRAIQLDHAVRDRYPDLGEANAFIFDDLMFRHWDSWRDGTYSHLFVAEYRDGALSDPVDVMAGERYDTPLRPFGGVEQIAWSADGRRIAYTAKKLTGVEAATRTNADIFVYDVVARETANLTDGLVGYDLEPLFSPDGRALAWVSMARDGYESDRSRVFLYDFATQTRRELSEGYDNDLHSPAWSPDGGTLFCTGPTQGTVQLFAVSVADGSIRQITDGPYDYGAFTLARADAGPVIVSARMSMSAPTELYRVDVASGTAEPITHVNDELLSSLTLGRVERRIVKATDGADVLTWVIYPPGFDPARTYPAILYAQGGPQSTVSQFFSYRWNFQALAANGYIVVAPNRRGVPSFGQAFKEAISEQWGAQAMDDLLSAIDDVAREPYVDRERLAAIGASFGGYSVFWLAGHHDGRFRTFVSHAGPFNLESMYGATEELFFVDFDLGGPYWTSPRPRSYDAFSPHRFVDRWDTPMLIVHGQKDYRVPVTEAFQAFTALRRQGLEGRLLYFPEQGHWIVTPQDSLLWHRVVYDWLARYLGPSSAGSPNRP